MDPASAATQPLLLKVIACEIAARELSYAAAHSRNLVDLELLTQGHHDTPAAGRAEIQQRIGAVPAGKYDAIVLGYGLCSNILAGLQAVHTPLVIPRAHDCITFFLGSKERYQREFNAQPGTYYYTSGWVECARRRGGKGPVWGGVPLSANARQDLKGAYEQWVTRYGEAQAKYLLEEMQRWSEAYSHGTLIDFEFTRSLGLRAQVQRLCTEKGWQFNEIPGDLTLLQRLLAGDWPEGDFLVVRPGQKVVATFDEKIIGTG